MKLSLRRLPLAVVLGLSAVAACSSPPADESSSATDEPIAAATSVGTQRLASLTSRGTTSVSALSTAAIAVPAFAIPSADVAGIKPNIDRSFPWQTPTPPPPTLVPPTATASQVLGNVSAFKGFSGLDHHDQRTANNGNQYSLEPPDQGLCAGHGFVVEAVNDVMRVYSTSGAAKSAVVDLNSFFHLPAEYDRARKVFGPFVGDPKCYFDRDTQRFFLTVIDIDTDPATNAFLPHSHVLIAVSGSSDPTGAWFLYGVDTTDDGTNGTPTHPGCPCFGDQPLIGADGNGFYVSTNEFGLTSQAFNGAQIYAMSKEALAAGGMPAVVHIDNLTNEQQPAASLQPAMSPEHLSSAHGTEYFLTSLDFTGLANQVGVWALTNTKSLETPTPAVTLTSAIIDSEVYGFPPNATQKSGPTPLRDCLAANCLGTGASVEALEQLSTNDDRMNQVVYANGRLWSGLNSVVVVSGEQHAGIAYFVVKPRWHGGVLVPVMEQQDYIAVEHDDVFYPSIGVTTHGEAVMAFTLTGADRYPSAAYAPIFRRHEDIAVHVAAEGLGPEDGDSGYVAFGGAGVARWGDYTAAVADGDSIYMSSEFIPAACTTLQCGAGRTTLANWGTFVSRVTP